MPYCVNCGVELNTSAQDCALCATPVILPAQLRASEAEPRPYSDRIVLPASVRRRFVAFILSVVMLIPNIVSGLINFLMPQTGVWAVYVIASSALVWVLFIQPFLWKKIHIYTQVLLDAIAIMMYIYVFYAVGNDEKRWFYLVALPLVLVLEAMVLSVVWWLKRRPRDWPLITIVLLGCVAVYSVFTDLLFHRFLDGSPVIGVSVVISVSCLALIGFFISVKKNRRLRAWLGRKFFL